MKKWIILLLFGGVFTLFAQKPVWDYSTAEKEIKVSLYVPGGIYLYSAETSVSLLDSNGTELTLSKIPAGKFHRDDISGKNIMVYSGPQEYQWIFPVRQWNYPFQLEVCWQGCSDGTQGKPLTCFMPEKATVRITGKMQKKVFYGTPAVKAAASEKPLFPEYVLLRSGTGYMNKTDFIHFLRGQDQDGFISFSGKSFLLILLLCFIGGTALNLTPCILPMIPINLAIIGARQGSRTMCVIRGLIYGFGMAAAYGILGVIAVLTGSSFGGIDSTWWFNAAIAVLFILLGLSLFDIFLFDLSKYRGGFRKPASLNLSGIFLMGGITALLAGACVAPVVAAMLLQAGKMYNEGEISGLILPFILGLGMALPWPLAAGGLAVLPKPGSWMKYVKYSFGVIIIGIGIYYSWQSWILFNTRSETGLKAAADRQILTDTLKRSAQSKKPILIDFRAEWCKNCLAMEQTTFRDPAVKKELKNFYFIKFDATAIREPEIKTVLQHFSVTGLPTYLIIQGK